MGPPFPLVTAGLFNIITPDVDELVAADSLGRVPVEVEDLAQNTRYFAQITDIGGTTVVGSGDLAQQDGTNIFSGLIGVGSCPTSPPAQNNKTVTVQAYQGSVQTDSDANDFKAWTGGSALGSAVVQAPAGRCDPSPPGEDPAPAALNLRLDAPVRPGRWERAGPLNRPTTLVYARDAAGPAGWFSPPLDLRPGGRLPGFWHLRRRAARVWVLVLRSGAVNLATYRLTAPAGKGRTFPARPRLVRAGDEFRGWPRTVTLSPGP